MHFAFTLCFLADPAATFRESRRVLAHDGGLIVGFVPKDTPWGDHYAALGRDGHPVYAQARFYSVADVERLLTESGLLVVVSRATLKQPPGLSQYQTEPASERVTDDAGFVALAAVPMPS